MATQQAWDDFCSIRSQVEYISGMLTNSVKDGALKLEEAVSEIVADPARLAACAALADQHPTRTTAYLLDKFTKILAVRDALVAQGF